MADDWTQKVIGAEPITYYSGLRLGKRKMADDFSAEYYQKVADGFAEYMRNAIDDAFINGTGDVNTQPGESLTGKPRLLDKRGRLIKEVD